MFLRITALACVFLSVAASPALAALRGGFNDTPPSPADTDQAMPIRPDGSYQMQPAYTPSVRGQMNNRGTNQNDATDMRYAGERSQQCMSNPDQPGCMHPAPMMSNP